MMGEYSLGLDIYSPVLSQGESHHFSHLPELHFDGLEHIVSKKNISFTSAHNITFQPPVIIDLAG